METIKQFCDAYAFLSNFYNAPVSYNGLTYQNSEAAFQAQKEIRDEDRKKYTSMNPSQAKLAGRHCNLRKDWEDIKEQTMYEIVSAKFTQNKNLAKLLIDTGNAYL